MPTVGKIPKMQFPLADLEPADRIRYPIHGSPVYLRPKGERCSGRLSLFFSHPDFSLLSRLTVSARGGYHGGRLGLVANGPDRTPLHGVLRVFTALLALGIVALIASAATMLPMRAVRLRLGTLLAADATTLAPASDANMVALVIAPFTNSETLVVGDLTLAADHGLAPIACATGAQEVALLPSSFAQIITMKPGATTGFRWVSSGSFPPPITIYGYALLDNALANVLAAQTLDAPVIISDAGQQIDLDPVTMQFVQSPLF